MGGRLGYNLFCLWDLGKVCNRGDIYFGLLGFRKVERVRKGFLRRENSEYNDIFILCEKVLCGEG